MNNDRNLPAKNDTPQTVPYVVYRDAVADNRWLVKKLVIALIIAVCLMFASNVAWLVVWNSYDYSSTETIVDSSENGVANFTGGNGGINYGPRSSTEDYQDEADGDAGNPLPEQNQSANP